MLDGFSRALQVYFAGAGGTCKFEPQWSTVYPEIAKPEDPPERKREVTAWLAEQKVTCGKLKMNPSACYGCPDNPLGDQQKQLDQAAFDAHALDIQMIEPVHDAVRMGLIRGLDQLDMLEFEKLRLYWNHVERLRLRASMPLL